MKALKELMYVRLLNGELGIYGNFEMNTNFRSNNGYSVISKSEIKKYSDDITELLEKGDYVNGYKVLGVFVDNGEKFVKVLSKVGYVHPKDILNILTKEIFEERKYIIGD